MKTTSRAFAWRFGLLAVVGSGCAQVLGVEGWSDTGAGGQGGEQTSTSTAAGGQSTVGNSSASAGGQSTVGNSSASAGGQSTVGSSSASAGGQSTVGSSSAGTGGQTSASSTGTGTCTPEGLPCQDPAECCGQSCNAGICTGCLDLGKPCAGGGCCQNLICGNPWKCCVHQGACTSHDDCCSNACFNGTCGVQCRDETESCWAHSECCPGLVCKGTCAIACASPGDSCSSNSDCCVDLVCEGGMCSATCKPLWKPCTGNADCCPGLMCPAGLCTAYPTQSESEMNGDLPKANMVYPGKVCGAIAGSGDQDWFAIVLPAGVTLSAVVGPGGGSTCAPGGMINSELEIRIPNSTIMFNDDIDMVTNHCSSAVTPISVSGTYFVRVAASQTFSPLATFGYCVTLTVSP